MEFSIGRKLAIIVLLFALALARATEAQQTVFNVPTTDILEQGQLYSELDFLYGEHSTSLTLRSVYGIFSGFETGVNIGGIQLSGPSSPTILATAKWSPVLFENTPLMFITGGEAGIALNPSYAIARGYGKIDAILLDERVRLGVGPYLATPNFYSTSGHGGVIASAEAKVAKWFAIAGDWMSGGHTSAFLAGGVIISPGDGRHVIYLAGVRHNSEGDIGALLEYGYHW